jgi:hypothetical protein
MPKSKPIDGEKKFAVGDRFTHFFAAALHASWNVLIKSESESLTSTVLIVAGIAVIGVVFLPFVPLPLQPCWPYLGASVVIHIVYFTLLLLAYR